MRRPAKLSREMNRVEGGTLVLTLLALTLACQKPLSINQPKGTPEMIAKRECVADLLMQGGPFQVLHRVSDIPAEVRPVFRKSEGFDAGADMAEPGAPFQSSDITDPAAPMILHRLRSVALSKSTCFVFYQVGGFGRGEVVAVFKRIDRDATVLLWHAQLLRAVEDPADLLAAMQNGEFRDPNP